MSFSTREARPRARRLLDPTGGDWGTGSPHSVFVGGGERSESVYLEHPTNQTPQPSVYEERKLTSEDPVIVAEWEYSSFVWWSKFIKELPKNYEALLELLEVEPEKYEIELEGFQSYLHKYDPKRRCDIENFFLPIIHCGRYHPYASVKHRRRASSRALERLEFLEKECRKRHMKFDYLIKIDLTLSKQISKLWNSEKVNRCIHRAVGDFLSELQTALFGDHSSQFGAISNHHYWATRTPLSPHRHIHLTIPNVCYNGKSDTFYRFRPYVKEELVKKVWKRCLKRNGLWNEVPDHVDPVVYIGYIKFEDRNRVKHRLSYCCRRPVEDMVENLGGVDLDDIDEEFALFLLDYTPRITNLGFLTNLKRFGYSHKPKTVKCPICGGEMYVECDEFGRALLFDRPPPDLPILYRNRSGLWEEFIV